MIGTHTKDTGDLVVQGGFKRGRGPFGVVTMAF